MSVTNESATPRGDEAATNEEFESRRSVLRRAGALSAGLFAALAARADKAHGHPGQGSPGCCLLAQPDQWCSGCSPCDPPFWCDHGGFKRVWYCVDTNNVTWGCGECISDTGTCWGTSGTQFYCSYGWIADGGGCFVAGTPVATPEGEKPIEELKAGEEVLAWDLTRGELVTTTVTELQCHEGEDAREVLEFNGEHGTVRVTPEHRFFDGLEWTPAAQLTSTVHLKLKQLVPEGCDAQWRMVSLYSRRLNGKHDVYNIHVAHPDHNYIAAGYIVHNVKQGGVMSGELR
jgi:hypothetical protein